MMKPSLAWRLPQVCGCKPRRGIVLIIVLVVIAVLALAAYTFAELMLSHKEAADLSGRQLQARSLVDSGGDSVKIFLMQNRQTRLDNGGLFNNPGKFRGLVVINDTDARDRGTFSVVSPSMDNSGNLGGVRYGLEDESTRLNLNSLMFVDKQIPGGGGAKQLLMGLPGMTEEIADAILDWLDEDDDMRESGAERDYYAGLDPPYQPKNGPFETVEELLLVRGVTPQLLFGKDVNRNGMVDPHEENLPLPDGVDNGDGTMDRGWSGYLTLYSSERNVTAQGLPRIYLNETDLEKLHSDLRSVFSVEWANFIVLYRQYGGAGAGQNQQGSNPEGGSGAGGGASAGGSPGAVGGAVGGGRNTRGGSGGSPGNTRSTNAAPSPAPSAGGGTGRGTGASTRSVTAARSGPMAVTTKGGGPGGAPGGTEGQPDKTKMVSAADVQMDFSKPGNTKFAQVLDLVGATVQIPAAEGEEGPTIVASPFPNDLISMGSFLPLLMDNASVSQAPTIPGRININQAPRKILEGIPGMSSEIVNEIISRRDMEPDGTNANRRNETWILTEGIVDLNEMKQFLPFVCAGGDIFRAQIVGYFQGGGPSSRSEVVFDATQTAPRILLWRDISHLGRGYALETLGVDLTETQ